MLAELYDYFLFSDQCDIVICVLDFWMKARHDAMTTVAEHKNCISEIKPGSCS